MKIKGQSASSGVLHPEEYYKSYGSYSLEDVIYDIEMLPDWSCVTKQFFSERGWDGNHFYDQLKEFYPCYKISQRYGT